jgi:hypothetical protein
VDLAIVRLLNQAQRKLCWEAPVNLTCATSVTVAGQEEYPLPSDYMKLEAVFLATDRKLTPIRVQQRDARENNSKSIFYYIHGANVSRSNAQTINLNPIPDQAYTLKIYYRQMPLAMVSGGQGPEIPVQWHDALPSYALWKTYRRWGRDWANMRDESKAEWEQWLQRARRYATPLQVDVPTRVEDTAGYMYVGGE